MRRAFLTQVVFHPRRVGKSGPAFRGLAVQKPQGVRVEPLVAGRAKLGKLRLVGIPQRLLIAGPAGRAAYGVQVHDNFPYPEHPEVVEAEADDLGVRHRRLGARVLHSHLVELAEPARLRPFVPEHGAQVIELRRLGLRSQAVLDVCPHDRGGVLGPQRYAAATPVLEGVHLLFDYVGGLAHAAPEKLGVLENRGPYLRVAVDRGEPS